MKWLTDMLAHFGHMREVAKPVEVARDRHSEQLRRRADRIYADLQAVRKIEIIVRRR